MGKLPNEGSHKGSETGAIFVQQATLEKLRCILCKKLLSVLPIYRNPKGDTICGRCSNIGNDFIRDTLFESAIEFQKFPCTNRESGCLEVLFPVYLADHETKCRYMKYECPTKEYNNCTWQGNLSNMVGHFEKMHPAFILKDCRFEVDFVNKHIENYLMPYGEDLYVVTREANSAENIFGVTVKYVGLNVNAENYMYNIVLESGNKAYKHVLKEKVGSKVEIQGKVITEKLHDPVTVVANIDIHDENMETNTGDITDNEDDDELDHEQLKEVECMVCMEYMVPPIFQCEVGHSFCKPCRDTQTNCPTCQAIFKQTQNFLVERIIMNMTYPCKHPKCKFKTKARDIRQHEATCVFGPFNCPVKEWENCNDVFTASQLFDHIKTKHYENLLELDTISVPFDNKSLKEDIDEVYILKYGRWLFRISFMYNFEDEEFGWSIQLVGPPEESAKYNYELEIIDSSGKNKRLYIKNQCSPLANKQDIFTDEEKYTYFEYDQISSFIKNQLIYRVLISKKH